MLENGPGTGHFTLPGLNHSNAPRAHAPTMEHHEKMRAFDRQRQYQRDIARKRPGCGISMEREVSQYKRRMASMLGCGTISSSNSTGRHERILTSVATISNNGMDLSDCNGTGKLSRNSENSFKGLEIKDDRRIEGLCNLDRGLDKARLTTAAEDFAMDVFERSIEGGAFKRMLTSTSVADRQVGIVDTDRRPTCDNIDGELVHPGFIRGLSHDSREKAFGMTRKDYHHKDKDGLPFLDITTQYKAALTELTFNSKPIITNLTILAGENVHASEAIASIISDHILEVPSEQKLPSLYLLDSIVKNIGASYVKHFAAKLPEVFVHTYKHVEPNLYPALLHLFKTWRGVFTIDLLRAIEAELQFNVPRNAGALSSFVSAHSPLIDDKWLQHHGHGIHVNPKYLEAQRQKWLQSSLVKEILPVIGRADDVINQANYVQRLSPGLSEQDDSAFLWRGEALYERKESWGERGSPFEEILGPRSGYDFRMMPPEPLLDAYGNVRGIRVPRLHSAPLQFAEDFRQKDRQSSKVLWQYKNECYLKERIIRSRGVSPPSMGVWARESGKDRQHSSKDTLSREFTKKHPSLKFPEGNEPRVSLDSSMERASLLGLATNYSVAVGHLHSASHSRPLPDHNNSLKSSYKSFQVDQNPTSGLEGSISDDNVLQAVDAMLVTNPSASLRVVYGETSNFEPYSPMDPVSELQNSWIQNQLKFPMTLQNDGVLQVSRRLEGEMSSKQPYLSQLSPRLQSSACYRAQQMSHSLSSSHPNALLQEHMPDRQSSPLPSQLLESLQQMQHHLPSLLLSLPSLNQQQLPEAMILQNSFSQPPVLSSTVTVAGLGNMESRLSRSCSAYLQSPLVPSSKPYSVGLCFDDSVLQPRAGPSSAASILAPLHEFSSGVLSGHPSVPLFSQGDAPIQSMPLGFTFSQSALVTTERTEALWLVGSPDLAIPLDFKQDFLRERHEPVIRSLYSDFPRQCTSCGLRFKNQDEHSRHMDWHVTKNRRQKSSKNMSRKWFVNVKEWLTGAETGVSEVLPSFFAEEVPVRQDEPETLAVPADEEQNTCALCGEPFEVFYSDDTEQWMYRGAIYMNVPMGFSSDSLDSSLWGPIVHAKCCSESSTTVVERGDAKHCTLGTPERSEQHHLVIKQAVDIVTFPFQYSQGSTNQRPRMSCFIAALFFEGLCTACLLILRYFLKFAHYRSSSARPCCSRDVIL